MDIYCLGLKNTFCNADFSPEKYRHDVLGGTFMQEQLVPCHVSLAHQIIYGAIDYAGQLRFEPQKDFKLSQYVLEERDHFDYVDRVEFGKDGKPLFISGPDDNSDRIIRQLETRVGQDNFDYIYGTNNPPVSTEF